MRTAADRLSRFDAEERRLDEALARVRRRRKDAFTQELEDFELSHDPFGILGLAPTQDVDAVKAAYRKLALRYHPDKVRHHQDATRREFEARFANITLAYVYLCKKLEQARSLSRAQAVSHMDLVQKGREHRPQAGRQGHSRTDQHSSESKMVDTRFDVGKFNARFDEFRLEDDADGGYADIMDGSDPQQDSSQPGSGRVFDGKFNRDVFNSAFEDCKRSDATKQVMVIDEPEALISGDLEYEELGRARPDDFGRTARQKSVYTDYKLAHTEFSTLIDPSSVETAGFEDVEQLKAARSNLSYDLSDDDRRKHALRKRQAQAEEEERELRLQDRDARVSRHYEHVNRLMLR
jgi:DnaJ-domain-containing protein 1